MLTAHNDELLMCHISNQDNKNRCKDKDKKIGNTTFWEARSNETVTDQQERKLFPVKVNYKNVSYALHIY